MNPDTYATDPAGVLDASSLIETHSVSRTQNVFFVLIFLTLALDGLDTQSMSYVGMNVAKEWHISMASLGSIFSLGLVGTAVGAFTLGTLGDVLGLKRVIVVVTLVLSITTVAMGFAPSLNMLAVCRFIIGVGVGGALPNLIALASQYAPSARRATIITLTGAGFPTGAVLGGVLTTGVLAAHGWRAVFIVAGCVPLLLTPVLFFLLPESIPKLLRMRDGQAKAKQLLERLFPGEVMNRTITWRGIERAKSTLPLVSLFQGGRAKLTLLLSLASFMSLLDVYLLSNWLPGLMQDAHSTPRESVLATTGYNIGGIIGAVLFGRLMDKFGFAKVLVTAYVIGALCIAALALGRFNFHALAAIVLVAGMFTIGNQGSLNALPALFLPDDMRATGTGWVSAVGRVGSILGPLIVGFLLSAHWTHSQILMLAAAPAGITAASIFMIFVLRLTGDWKNPEDQPS